MTEIETMRGDVLTKQEMAHRGIQMVTTSRGGVELRAPTYSDTIASILLSRGIIDDKHHNAACDYMELKNAVYGFLNVKTMAGILQTGEAGAKRGHAEMAYYAATKSLGKQRDKIITEAMNTVAGAEVDNYAISNAYRMAFHAVFDAMQDAIAKVKQEIEKELAYT